jgi:hypothetical protein
MSFDELVGREGLGPEEEARLRRVHELLVAAGPPPELAPDLEAGPTLAMTLGGRRRKRGAHRPLMLLAAALCVLALAFLGGYLAGNHNGGISGRTLQLRGTAAAPNALASLVIQPVDAAGNWPMHLSATGLPKLPRHGYYEVFLSRDGRPLLPCGAFIVRSPQSPVSVQLNAPYHLRPGDSWVVTKEVPGQPRAEQVVLRPLT